LRHVEDMSCHHFGTHSSGTMVIDDLRCAPGRTTGSDINMMPHS
jgi:hypothetical protein